MSSTSDAAVMPDDLWHFEPHSYQMVYLALTIPVHFPTWDLHQAMSEAD